MMILRASLLFISTSAALLFWFLATTSAPAGETDFASLGRQYEAEIQPLLQRLCADCHTGESAEAEVDLSQFATLEDVRRAPRVWQQIREMFESGQMPPPDSEQPTTREAELLRQWVRQYLTREAESGAGDPGPVILRRLNNAEYTYTIRDLTGIDTLDPAREFPSDSAAGEGFTNTGSALVMSPSMVTKYLDAAKQVAEHAVLLPDGFRFSPYSSRRDWTNESVSRIQDFYRRHADAGGGTAVNLQGIQFETNQGGRLPVERYFQATLQEREHLRSGEKSLDEVAAQYQLNSRYLSILWETLDAGTLRLPRTPPSQADHDPEDHDPEDRAPVDIAINVDTSPILARIRSRWLEAEPGESAELAAMTRQWQEVLWKFNSIGHLGRHLGRQDGPESWMEPVTPLVTRRDFRIPLEPEADPGDVVVYLAAGNAGDGSDHDVVVWENPRLVASGRPDIALRDVRQVIADRIASRRLVQSSVVRCLAAAAEVEQQLDESFDLESLERLAARHEVEPRVLAAWLNYLGLHGGETSIQGHLTQQQQQGAGYAFVQGWAEADALGVMANSSDQHVRIPGNLKPHGIAVHPSPTQQVVIGWRSPVATTLRVTGAVQHAHPECGNGVTWALELRRGKTRRRLAAGVAHGPELVRWDPIDSVTVRRGDVIVLAIGPRDGNHSCDLTAVDLTLTSEDAEWDLAQDVSPRILAGNPQSDQQGNPDVWHFFGEPDSGETPTAIPAGSLLARWQSSFANGESLQEEHPEKQQLARSLEALLQDDAPVPDNPSDVALVRQILSLGGPLLSAMPTATQEKSPAEKSPAEKSSTEKSPVEKSPEVQTGQPEEVALSVYGLAPERFGRLRSGDFLEPNSLAVQAPEVLEIHLPADFAAGYELVVSGMLAPEEGREGSVQLEAGTSRPEMEELDPRLPVLVADTGPARERFKSAFDAIRQLFPAALCYERIVPVDEVVTLTLFYREDDHLQRLMLGPGEIAELDRLWNELFYISQEPLQLADAFEQLVEYATQDSPHMVKALAPMTEPVQNRAADYRQLLLDTESVQLEDLWRFARRAYRRPLADQEIDQFQSLYSHLRQQDISHEDAFRVTLARILVAPAFLYRIERPRPGESQYPVSDFELANRLSYFLWSSLPDEALLEDAQAGRLRDPAVLLRHLHRMRADEKTQRFAKEFGGQWLHIHEFDQHDEKSERHFPTFSELRGLMYEESIHVFRDLFQEDRSILDLLDTDATYLNETLAQHYGIPGVQGTEWRRVEGVRQFSRGGILTQAATLSKQSGASRTSPILRGNWISEVVLGERLPRPPPDVPVLADALPEGLTERQLIEKHSADPACAKCHERIDPFGFALEHFDAIGRFRERDSAGLPIDAQTELPDGTSLEGHAGLQRYLRDERRTDFVRQFCRKLLGYALGRSIQLSDEPLLDEMVEALEKQNYRVTAPLESILLSPQFREIRGQDWLDEQ
jgi:hypothetical protein